MKALNNFFVAKFSKVSPNSDKFRADARGNMPLIGEVFAGKYRSSIINGTRAEMQGIVEGKLYLCTNSEVEVADKVTGELKTMINTTIVSEVSPIELIQLKGQLGDSFHMVSTPTVEAEEVEAEAEPDMFN